MRRAGSVAVLVALLLLAGCGADEPKVPPTPTLSPLQVELNAAAEAWQAAGIDDYTMEINFRHPGWNVQTLSVEVRDGQPEIKNHGCFPERTCAKRDVEAGRLTIDNIIAEVQAAAGRGLVQHVVYHEAFHFPRIAEVRKEASWEVSNFQLLTEP